MSVPKKIIKNFNSLMVGEVVNRVVHIAVIIYIARIMGADSFGKINFALALVTYFFVTTNLGLNDIGTRDVAKEPGKANLYADSIISIRSAAAAVSMAILGLFVFFMNKSADAKYLILTYSLMLIPYAISLEWVFRGVEKMEYIGASRIISAVFYAVPIIIFVKSSDQLILVAALTVLSEVAGSGFLYLVFKKKFGALRMNFNIGLWAEFLRQSFPLCVSSVMIMTYLNSGTILLGFFKSDTEVGIYSAAYRLIMILYMVNSMFIFAVFPTIAKFYKESKEKLEKLFVRLIKVILVAGLPVGIAVSILKGQVINLVYGGSFTGSAAVLGILIWFVVINFISFILSYSLVACDRQKSFLAISAWAALVNIILNLLLIPFFGAIGAAVAMCISEIVVLVLAMKEMKKIIDITVFRFLGAPVVASLIMGAFLFIFRDRSIFLLASAGAAIYFLYLFMTGVLNEDIILIKSLIKG